MDFEKLPETLDGYFLQWCNKETNVCRMHFRVDNEYENIPLASVLRPTCNFKFVVGNNGKSVPQLSAHTRAREGAAGSTSNDAADDGPVRTVDINYKENGIDKIQTWTYEKSDAIKVDARKGHRFKPKLNVQPGQYDTPFKFFLNVCLPPDFVNGFVGFANTNGPLGTMNCDAVHKSLTYGEAVKFFLYILTICLYPGDALDELWGETFGEDDIVHPLGFG